MNVTSVCLCVLISSLSLVSGQNLKSPCSGDFEFDNDVAEFGHDGGKLYGTISLIKQFDETPVSALEVKIYFSVEGPLLEHVENIRAPEDVISRYNRGETVRYRVHLPLVSPWPKVTQIAVNGKAICTGSGDKPMPNRNLSFPSVLQGASYGFSSGPPRYKRFAQEPNTTPWRNLPTDLDLNTYDPGYIKQLIKWKFGSSYVPSPITQQTTTPSTTPRPTTTTTPVYFESVTQQTPRPVQIISSSQTTTTECGVVDGQNGIQTLIQNGLSYERGEVPWLVAIYQITKKSLSVICGGTLVSDRHVVTAAHCMFRRVKTDVKDVVIKVGVHELDDWSDNIVVVTKPIAADIPDEYDYSTLKNDIMVLTLDKRMNFTNFIRPACLWSGNTDLSRIVGSIGIVAGWGGENKYNAVPLDEPKMVRVPIVSTQVCRASKAIFHTLTSDKTLCAGSKNGDGPCQGDSGGGLYLKEGGKWRLRGVVSISTQNDDGDTSTPCNLHQYVVYTDTAQYLPWIRSVLSRNYFD